MLVPVPQASAAHLFSSSRRYFLTIGVFLIKRFLEVSLKMKTKPLGYPGWKSYNLWHCFVLLNHIGQHPRGATLLLQPATDLILSRILMKILVRM